MQALDDSGAWFESQISTEPCVIRSSRWPHFATSVIATDATAMGAWVQGFGPARLEEVATTLERLGANVTFTEPTTPIRASSKRIRGRISGWRNVSARARYRHNGLADSGSVLSETLEVLSGSMPRYAEWLGRNVTGGEEENVLEVGAGTGTMTRVLASQCSVVAFEPASDARGELFDNTRGLPNVRVVGSIEECRDFAPFDSIVLVNVLEHIEHDVQFLVELKAMLATQGKIVVLSPAHNCLYSNFDASIGHVRRYTRERLKLTFESAGLVNVRVRYFNSVGAILWMVVNRLLKREAASSGQTNLYDRFIVPLSALVDRARIRPFGQSVIGSAQIN